MKKQKWMDIIFTIIIVISVTAILRPMLLSKIANKQNLDALALQQITTKTISLMEGSIDTIQRSQLKYPVENEAYATIHNDERGFQKDLYYGDNDDILDKAIGQSMRSKIPGEGKPILLAGHNGTHFSLLPEFAIGDHVQIDTTYGSFTYEVYDNEIILADDFDVALLDQEEELLIMYTCYPFDVIKTEQRYFVYAKKIDGPRIQEGGSWKE